MIDINFCVASEILEALNKFASSPHGFQLVKYEVYGLVAKTFTTRIINEETKRLKLEMRIVPMGKISVFSVYVLNTKAYFDVNKVNTFKNICDIDVKTTASGGIVFVFKGDTASLMSKDVWKIINSQIDVVFDCVCIK